MAVEQVNLPFSKQGAFVSTRFLGTLGMIASPMLFTEGMLYTFGHGEGASARIIPLLGIIYLAGWACSLASMRRLRATGHGTFAKALFTIQLTGLLLALLFNVQEMIRASQDTLVYRITDIAWPASHVLMLVTGLMVLKSKLWRGWRTVAPFLCGLALPAFFAASAVVGREIAGPLFGILTMVAFMLLGYAVRTDNRRAAA
jgi:hypothetical protein